MTNVGLWQRSGGEDLDAELSTGGDKFVWDRPGLYCAEPKGCFSRFSEESNGLQDHRRVVPDSIKYAVEASIEQIAGEFLRRPVVTAGGMRCSNPKVSQDGAIAEVGDVDGAGNSKFGEAPTVDLHVWHRPESSEHFDIGGERLLSQVAGTKPVPVILHRVEAVRAVSVEPGWMEMTLVDPK